VDSVLGGIFVKNVLEKSAAAYAGVGAGDRILEVNGQSILTMNAATCKALFALASDKMELVLQQIDTEQWARLTTVAAAMVADPNFTKPVGFYRPIQLPLGAGIAGDGKVHLRVLEGGVDHQIRLIEVAIEQSTDDAALPALLSMAVLVSEAPPWSVFELGDRVLAVDGQGMIGYGKGVAEAAEMAISEATGSVNVVYQRFGPGAAALIRGRRSSLLLDEELGALKAELATVRAEFADEKSARTAAESKAKISEEAGNAAASASVEARTALKTARTEFATAQEVATRTLATAQAGEAAAKEQFERMRAELEGLKKATASVQGDTGALVAKSAELEAAKVEIDVAQAAAKESAEELEAANAKAQTHSYSGSSSDELDVDKELEGPASVRNPEEHETLAVDADIKELFAHIAGYGVLSISICKHCWVRRPLFLFLFLSRSPLTLGDLPIAQTNGYVVRSFSISLSLSRSTAALAATLTQTQTQP
jgi:hypothetical protein